MINPGLSCPISYSVEEIASANLQVTLSNIIQTGDFLVHDLHFICMPILALDDLSSLEYLYIY